VIEATGRSAVRQTGKARQTARSAWELPQSRSVVDGQVSPSWSPPNGTPG
jgi:hypothetical protein